MAKKINVMTDVKLEVSMPMIPFYCGQDLVKIEKFLKDWVSEFEEFIRDHRSQDPVHIYVKRVMEDICSSCERVWETYSEDGKIFCASCGEEIEVEVKA